MPSEILKNKRLTIGFDPNLFTKKTITFFGKNNCNFKPLENNLVDKIWKRKLKFSKNNFYKLPENSVGESYKLKINKIVYNLKKKAANYHFITASENSAWLFNIRGRDVKYSPLPHSYVLINQNKDIKFFCDLKKVSKSFKKKFNKVKFLNKRALRAELSKINGMKFLIDKNTCSIFYENLIVRNNKILDLQDPIYNLKAIKSKKEITNIRKTHIYDGVALTKFLIWLKKIIQKRKITELSAAKQLLNFRKINKKFKFSSFPTISGSGPNGAIIHYKPTIKTNRNLNKGDIYLVDSGGQYEFGTTDVTRTISLNNTNKRIKNIFTRVLKGHIAVTNYNLKKILLAHKLILLQESI